ncbi:nuclear transport factor 2 family protein [Sinobacterium norvegicum]|uniref:nuclear transport factor 2 family protein n=1 Tax=Sinobacterium norvegicum TaxID=1641715 RepID=UPI001F355055|nr:nuclear transport factor 2 family protein [Sinobacterium norvegicum]
MTDGNDREGNVGSLTSAEQIAHRQAILDTLYTHSRGLDRVDAELIKSTYWPEAVVDYGAYKGAAYPFAELIGPALSSQYELTQHVLGQTLIDLQGSMARTETYVQARHLLIAAQEELSFSGRYLDTLELRGDEWRIIQRQVVMDWSRCHAVTDQRDSEAFGQLSKGHNTADDPSYPFFKENQ